MKFIVQEDTGSCSSTGSIMFTPPHAPADPIGSLWDMENSDFKKVKCNKYNMSWYPARFRVYFHRPRSIRPRLKLVPSMLNHISRVKRDEQRLLDTETKR